MWFFNKFKSVQADPVADTAVRIDHSVPIAAKPALADLVAPEDVRIGDFVIVHEQRNDMFGCSPVGEPARFSVYLPDAWPTRGRVVAVALPFIAVDAGAGDRQLIDVRRERLARLPAFFAEAMNAGDTMSLGGCD